MRLDDVLAISPSFGKNVDEIEEASIQEEAERNAEISKAIARLSVVRRRLRAVRAFRRASGA